MKTGSLRTRVIVTALALLAVVLIAVVAATTLLYRASLRRDLDDRVRTAATAVRGASAVELKQLIPGLALEGIATDVGPLHDPSAERTLRARKAASAGPARPAVQADAKPGIADAPTGTLTTVQVVLADGTHVRFSASQSEIGRSVRRLLLIEGLVAVAALALAALLLLRISRAALAPLSVVARTARGIAGGDRAQRLRPDRADTELGSMAAAFDQMVDALEAAIARAEHAEASMRGFLADASHELRTPVAALQGSAETLLREQPERPDRDAIEAGLARDAARLGRLVDDLLGLTRAEAQHRNVPLRLDALAVQEAADASRRAGGLPVTVQPCEPAATSGDPDALRRLLRNLLDNAVAVAPAGDPRVNVAVQHVDGHVEAIVTDNGPGVPAADRDRVFQRFVRLDRGRPGNGIGLAIAQRIAQQHGGTLTCDPAERGARFTLRLPARR
jgi:signal transduction histidine kinase